jgi:hypothetical protein
MTHKWGLLFTRKNFTERRTCLFFTSLHFTSLHFTSLITRTLNRDLQLRTFHGCLPPRTTGELDFGLSYKPLIRHAENVPSNGASIVSLLKRETSLPTRSRDPSPLFCHPSVYSCYLATGDVFTSALRSNVCGATLTARKHCFLILLRNCRVYRGAAYEHPEQIYANPLSLQALQGRSYLPHISYATTAAMCLTSPCFLMRTSSWLLS